MSYHINIIHETARHRYLPLLQIARQHKHDISA